AETGGAAGQVRIDRSRGWRCARAGGSTQTGTRLGEKSKSAEAQNRLTDHCNRKIFSPLAIVLWQRQSLPRAAGVPRSQSVSKRSSTQLRCPTFTRTSTIPHSVGCC